MPLPARLDALVRLTALSRLSRTGWLLRGVRQSESIAAHGLGVLWLVLSLGAEEDPPLDLELACRLTLVHDAPEALSGDIPGPAAAHLPAGAKAAMERVLAKDLLTPLGAGLLADFSRWEEGTSREARFVRLCDRLHMGIELLALQQAGQRGLEEFGATLAALDCGSFPSCARLQAEILASLPEALS